VRDLDLPKVTFGIIVLNGEPFTRYCLRALYPFAHEIIVVEGAAPAAAKVATLDGHSTDGTLEILYRFKAEEDPQDKVQIITREGFWSEKDEQSQAYAKRATGDYLWQVDIDEFYDPRDMQTILGMLRGDPEITAVSFEQVTFWGGFDYVVDGWYLRRGANIFHRLFKWGPGYQYATHRPPTVIDPQGRELRQIKWLNGHELARLHVYLYHYALLFPKQVIEKCEYYGSATWLRREKAQRWAREVFVDLKSPYRVHNVYRHPSWLERFDGNHPPQVMALRDDIEAGRINVLTRSSDDIERLLDSFSYQMGRALIRGLEPVNRFKLSVQHLLTNVLLDLFRVRRESKNEDCPSQPE
jgi:glycosyltransferase involved in cell wall biosynthesis